MISSSITGRIWKLGDDINTDLIIPARYLYTTDFEELGRHCLEDLDPEFPNKLKSGDIIVAGEDFGCGSSREHAPMALLGAGVTCVIAKSYARIFYRNSINIGLPILECAEAVDALEEGSVVEVNVRDGLVKGVDKPAQYQAKPIPDLMRRIIDAGGLFEFVKASSTQA